MIVFPVRGPSRGYVKNYASFMLDDRQLILTGGLNVYNKLGGVEMFPGWKKFWSTALTGTPLFLGVFQKSDLTKKLIALTNQKAYAWNTSTLAFDNITRQTASVDVDYTATIFQPWSACVYRDLFIFTNGTDNIQKWNMTGRAVDLGGTPPKAKLVMPFHDHLLLGNVGLYPDEVDWSAQNNAEDWTAASGSGSVRLTETPDEIQAMLPLQNVVIIYKKNAWYLCEYIGAPWYFKFSLRQIVSGPISQRAVVGIPGGVHFYLGQDNIYRNDGISSVGIGGPIRDELFGSLNKEVASLAFAAADYENQDVYFIIPTTGNTTPNRMYVYNYAENIWSPPIDFPATCFGEYWTTTSLTIDQMTNPIDSYLLPIDSDLMATGTRIKLFGSSDGYIRQMDPNFPTRDGAQFTAYVDFKGISAGTMKKKRMLRIKAETQKLPTEGLNVYGGVTDDPDGVPAFYSFGSLTPSGNPWANGDCTGRYVSVRFKTDTSDNRWRINSYELEFIPQSER